MPEELSRTAQAFGQSLEPLLEAELTQICQSGLRRSLHRIDSSQDTIVTMDGHRVLLFCSNNYLGLANHPEVVEAACRASRRYGASSVSSRLISGHMAPHAELEEKIAAWKGCPRALLFSTGYQANLGTITALAGPEDYILSDELNHASIIDGCRLSRARIGVYRHNDLGHLSELLSRAVGKGRQTLVITESVFSMDGDCAPLAGIADQCRRHGAWLMVDEAHATGVFGANGAGLVAELGLGEKVDIQLGTLGKALGSFGAYVAGSSVLIDLLINRARPFIFTTALPPAAAAAAQAAIAIIEREPQRGLSLRRRAQMLGLRLRRAGLNVPHLESQILPVVIGTAQAAVALAQRLFNRGFYVAAIRPPTVAEGSSRLRLSLMATHSPEQIEQLGDALVACTGAGS